MFLINNYLKLPVFSSDAAKLVHFINRITEIHINGF